MQGRAGKALSIMAGLMALILVATVIVGVVLVAGLEPWQRQDVLNTLRGSRVARAPRADGGADGEKESLHDKLQDLANEIRDHEEKLAVARLELGSSIGKARDVPPAPGTAAERLARRRAVDSLAGQSAEALAAYVLEEMREGRTKEAVSVLRDLPDEAVNAAIGQIAGPVMAGDRRAGQAPPAAGETAVVQARLELEERANELRRHYRSQRDKLQLLLGEIKERETQMGRARQELETALQAEKDRRDSAEKQAAQENRQKVLKLFGSMDAAQVADHLRRMIKEGKITEAAGMVKALPGRKAAEVLSEMQDAEDRKTLIDSIWRSEQANAAETR